MSNASPESSTLVAALREASAGGTPIRPGQLRVRVEQILGAEESARLRREIHQVVAAAEDNLPANLTRITPLTPQSLQRLSAELAESRGWRAEVAVRTTRIWASALGFEQLAAISWPAEDSPVPGGARPAASIPNVGQDPTALPARQPAPPAAEAGAERKQKARGRWWRR